MRRQAFSLTELLVVIGIIGVLIALLLPAVQRVRDYAARTKCANNLHQIVLAAHQYHDLAGSFPAGMRDHDGTDPYLYMSWLTQLLPYLDQVNLWQLTQSAYAQSPSPFTNPPHVGLDTVIGNFICPSDPRAADVQRSRIEGWPVALTCYLGVEGKDLTTNDGIFFRDSHVRFADIKDGASRTLFAGERPPSADFEYGWWYAGVGQQGTGSAETFLGVVEQDVLPYSMAPCFPDVVFEYGPGQITNQCDMLHFWSLHTGGANFAFADGSVRFLSYSAAPLMPALASRAGGETVEAP
jgi:prepilin-type processing-associated H-X9-DG protein/prepilin-type N-terminal cleavage/methylation domain-containing protein